jgi:YfiR/HmsC-like
MSLRSHSGSARLAAAAMTMVMWIVAPAAAGTAEAQVPAEKQALIMLRILAYDHALAARAGTAVRLAVVHGGSAAALQCAGRMRSALDDLVKRVVVTGKPLEVETVPVAEVSGAALARRRLAVLYVCSGSDAELPSVVQAARAAHVLTFTDELAYLARGLSIALSEDGPRVGISVNLIAARAEGARLNGQLLRLSKVVAR